MGLGGLPNVGGAGQQPNPNNQGAGKKGGGQEFSLEQQNSNANNQQAQAHAAQARNDLIGNGSKLMKIVDKRRKNRKYAPRTMLIDGEIYEVYLLATA